MRLQLTTMASLRHVDGLSEPRLCFRFFFGPLEVSCFATMPDAGARETDVTVRISLKSRVIVDADASHEHWLIDDQGRAHLEQGDRERVPLGPVLLFVDAGEMRVALRRRTLIDTRFKHVEAWKIVKTT